MAGNMGGRLTMERVRKLDKGAVIWDGLLKGFCAVGNGNGSVSFRVKTRVNGRQRLLTIGKQGNPWTVETARREAETLLLSARGGSEPVPERIRDRERPDSFKKVAERFLEEYGQRLKPSTREQYERLLRLHVLPALGSRLVTDIRHEDIVVLHGRLVAKPRGANYVIAVVSRIMTWCEARGWRPRHSNPCEGIERYEENERERFLSPEEFRSLGDVIARVRRERTESVYVLGAIEVIIYTGARKNEILTLRWDFVDKRRRVLVLPDSKTGAKDIWLNRHALEIIDALPRVDGNPYVFVGNVNGAHLVNMYKPWERLRQAAGLPDVNLHDLRHSFGGMAVDAGGQPFVVGKQMGHKDPRMHGKYQHVRDARVAELAEDTGELIYKAMHGTTADDGEAAAATASEKGADSGAT